MSTVLREIDEALAGYQAQHRARPVAVYLGQFTLDVDLLGAPPALSTDAGRPLAYRRLELLRDEVNVDGLRVI